jgi:hypothetical protein
VIAGNTGSGNRGAIQIDGATSTGNLVEGNFIGIQSNGTASLPNGGPGVLINAPRNTIGGTTAAARNVLSGNLADGIKIEGSANTGNVVEGNFIGTNAAGTAALGNSLSGVYVGAPNTTVGGTVGTTPGGAASGAANVISGNTGGGNRGAIWIDGATSTGNLVVGNLIGLRADGMARLPNGAAGVLLTAPRNTIGGTTAAARNVISANMGDGILINGAANIGNVIEGNFIGTNAAGNGSLGNAASGVEVIAAAHTMIGGTIGTTSGGPVTGAANLISGNLQYGIRINSSGATNNLSTVVQGNLIGTDRTGTTDVGNSTDGVLIENASNNTVGGVNAGAANIIAFNGTDLSHPGGYGVEVKATGGTAATGNSIRGNAIVLNVRMGIYLFDPARPDDLPLNDPGQFDQTGHLIVPPDADTGPNNLQNYPVVTSVDPANGGVEWQLDSTPNTTFTIDFYSNDQPHPSGYGDGEFYLGSLQVQTDDLGIAGFSTHYGAPYISATATDPDGNTSCFSVVDTAGDGLADAWKTRGIDYNQDGIIDLTLNVNPKHKNLFVEVVAMAGVQPAAVVFDRVIAAFAAAPNALVHNPDGQDGITLHVLPVKTIPYRDYVNGWADFDADKAAYFGDPGDSPATVQAKAMVYRYCVFGASFQDDPMILGKSELTAVQGKHGIFNYGGNDLGIYAPPDPSEGFTAASPILSGLFMHELGHTLGLGHGGRTDDSTNYKPNYFSVMNYTWVFPGFLYVQGGSRGRLLVLVAVRLLA